MNKIRTRIEGIFTDKMGDYSFLAVKIRVLIEPV